MIGPASSSKLATFLPPQPYKQALRRRGLVAWFGIRGLLLFAGLLINAGLVIHIIVSPIIVTLAVFAVLVDLRIAHENILLANLGVPTSAIILVAATYPFALECLAQLTAILLGVR